MLNGVKYDNKCRMCGYLASFLRFYKVLTTAVLLRKRVMHASELDCFYSW